VEKVPDPIWACHSACHGTARSMESVQIDVRYDQSQENVADHVDSSRRVIP